MSLHPAQVLIEPVVSEKSYHQITQNRYTFKVHKDAHKTQIRQAVELLQGWGQATPTVVVAGEDEETLIKSFRNLPKVLVTVPAELEVAHVVWARSLVVSEAALPLVQGRAAS